GSGRGGGDRGGAPRPAQPQQQPLAARELEITDEKIFQRLLDAGLDLGQEAVIEAFLYFNGEGPARRVAAQLDEGGYTTYVDPSPPGRWLLEAVSQAVPTPEHIAAMGTGLRNLARSNNGLYDGWWAVEPPEDEVEASLPEPEPAEA
ncbi:MAG TPA: ribonuclease E inhibitor RraB, partial [Candidatus Dormibacteraeota bacterium]